MSHVAALTVSTFAAASAVRVTTRWTRSRRRDEPILFRANGTHGLRVALFSGNYNCVCDGANRALNRLVRQLVEEEGADVRVYSPVVDEPAFEPAGTLIGVPSIPIPGRSEYRVALGLPRSVRRDLAMFAPDIIHVSAPDLLGRAAQRFAAERGIPVVASMHTRFETYFDYYGLGLLKLGAERWLRHFYAASDCVLAPTTTIRTEMEQAGLVGRTRLWGRGVDPALFSPSLRDLAWRRSQGFADDDVIPLFLGRLVLEKGLDCFVKTIAIVRERGYRVRPLIVGEGPARGWLAERLPNAVFAGHLGGTDLGRAVASADILVNPSITEAFGNVTLEAMASGLAVICPDVGSTRDLIRNDWNGLMVESRPEMFADGLAQLIDSPERRLAMGRAASFQSASYSWAKANAAVVEAYRSLVGLGRGAASYGERPCER
jgi:glycosyltransferase involved in cell wall biosynthesis